MSEYKDPHPWPLFHSKGSEPEETFIVRQSRIQEASVPSSGHQFCISIVCPIFPCRCEIHIWFLPVQKEWKYLDFCTEDHSYLLHKPKSYFLWGLSHLKKKKKHHHFFVIFKNTRVILHHSVTDISSGPNSSPLCSDLKINLARAKYLSFRINTLIQTIIISLLDDWNNFSSNMHSSLHACYVCSMFSTWKSEQPL